MVSQHGRGIIQVTLVVVLLVFGCSSALKHEKKEKLKQTEEKQKNGATSKIKAGRLFCKCKLGTNWELSRDVENLSSSNDRLFIR